MTSKSRQVEHTVFLNDGSMNIHINDQKTVDTISNNDAISNSK